MMRPLARRSAAQLLVCAAALAGWSGCSEEDPTTVCDQAADKFANECRFPTKQTGELECSGQLECVSRCAVAAECEEIERNDPDSTYGECMAACAQ